MSYPIPAVEALRHFLINIMNPAMIQSAVLSADDDTLREYARMFDKGQQICLNRIKRRQFMKVVWPKRRHTLHGVHIPKELDGDDDGNSNKARYAIGFFEKEQMSDTDWACVQEIIELDGPATCCHHTSAEMVSCIERSYLEGSASSINRVGLLLARQEDVDGHAPEFIILALVQANLSSSEMYIRLVCAQERVRAGVGGLLMMALMQNACALKLRRITLTAATEGLLPYYQGLGFEPHRFDRFANRRNNAVRVEFKRGVPLSELADRANYGTEEGYDMSVEVDVQTALRIELRLEQAMRDVVTRLTTPETLSKVAELDKYMFPRVL